MTQEQNEVIIPEVEKAIDEWIELNWDKLNQEEADFPF